MTTKLNRRVARETADRVYEQGENRPVIVELEAGGALLRLRLKGRRTSYPLTFGELYRHAVKIHVAATRAKREWERAEKRMAARGRS